MYKDKKIGIVIAAAGVGKRMGKDVPKQFLELDGKPIIIHKIEKMLIGLTQQCIRFVIARP